MASPLYVAIDTAKLDHAHHLAVGLNTHVGGVKLGLEFFNAHGKDGVKKIAERGLPYFLDLKLHDIPNTVAKAVAALSPLRPRVLTVHAAGGIDMMRAAKEAASDNTRVVGVTMLTSLDDDDLKRQGVKDSASDHVERLADMAREAGLDGIVCSGFEVEARKKAWPEGYFVVPGVRPAGSAESADQKRVVTPVEAMERGATIIVVGRPITEAENPPRAAAAIADTL